MKLSEQFGEGSFDAVYAIEATVHAPTFEGIYGEIFKVLKPGGVAGIYEWVMTDQWDASNPEHKRIAHAIEIGDGIAEMRNAKNAYDALVSTGFESQSETHYSFLPWQLADTRTILWPRCSHHRRGPGRATRRRPLVLPPRGRPPKGPDRVRLPHVLPHVQARPDDHSQRRLGSREGRVGS